MNRSMRPQAIAKIQGGGEYLRVSGVVKLYQQYNGTVVEATVTGLPITETGFFAFHIHEGGECIGRGFPNTGDHFNPGKQSHPKHAGDLPPLLSDHGKSYSKVFTDRFRVDEVIGKSIIIHSAPDDFDTQPSGNAGRRIACGVIERNTKLRNCIY